METGKEAKSPAGFGQIVRALAFTPDGKHLAAAGGDRGRGIASHVRIWNVDSGPLTASLSHKDPVRALVFSPDGTELASGGLEFDVSVWDVAGMRRRPVLEGHSNAVNGLAFSPEGQRLASAGLDDRLCLWNTKTGLGAGRIDNSNGAWSVAFSPDGRMLTVGGKDEGSFSDVAFWHTASYAQDTN